MKHFSSFPLFFTCISIPACLTLCSPFPIAPQLCDLFPVFCYSSTMTFHLCPPILLFICSLLVWGLLSHFHFLYPLFSCASVPCSTALLPTLFSLPLAGLLSSPHPCAHLLPPTALHVSHHSSLPHYFTWIPFIFSPSLTPSAYTYLLLCSPLSRERVSTDEDSSLCTALWLLCFCALCSMRRVLTWAGEEKPVEETP